jgi:hypothetical protein
MKELPNSKLTGLVVKSCENSMDLLAIILPLRSNLRELRLCDCKLFDEAIERLLHISDLNYHLRKINITYKSGSQYDPFKITGQQSRASRIETLNSTIARLEIITDRNQGMHNCLAVIMRMLLIQKFSTRNWLTLIGRDCTRIIARLLFEMRFDSEWLQFRHA